MKIFVNGEFVDEESANVLVLDQGYQFGYGVYDTLRTYDGKISNLKDHMDRLRDGAGKIGVGVSLSDAEIKDAIDKLIEVNGIVDAKVKIMVSKGVNRSTISIVSSDMDGYHDSIYAEGVKLVTTSFQRALPEIKTMNYLPCLLAASEAKKKGAFDGLLCDCNGRVTEGSFSNFFVFKDGVLITAGSGMLEGITRKIVLELAKGIFEIEFRNLTKEEAYSADEAFLSVTTGEIIPVCEIDGNKIKMGENTKVIAQKYKGYIKNV